MVMYDRACHAFTTANILTVHRKTTESFESLKMNGNIRNIRGNFQQNLGFVCKISNHRSPGGMHLHILVPQAGVETTQYIPSKLLRKTLANDLPLKTQCRQCSSRTRKYQTREHFSKHLNTEATNDRGRLMHPTNSTPKSFTLGYCLTGDEVGQAKTICETDIPKNTRKNGTVSH